MRLYLIQHGEARPKEEDPDRRLTERGLAEVRKMAAFLKPLGLSVQAIRQSGKTRARQTAEVIAGVVESAEGVVEWSGLGPDDPVGPMAHRLAAEAHDLVIVGHLPFLRRLVSLLVVGDQEAPVVAFRYGGVLCLERGADGWTVAWYIVPALLP